MAKMYGNYYNRVMENTADPQDIVVGMMATQTWYTDRDVWEVIEVKDQKHVTVREMKATCNKAFTQDWTLESDLNGRTMELTKRGKNWYETATVTLDEWKEAQKEMEAGNLDKALGIVVRGGFDPDKIEEKGKQTKWYKRSITFGVNSYYYDWEF